MPTPKRLVLNRNRTVGPARTLSRMALPEHGLTHDDILDALAGKRARDARWQDGRTFGMVYDGGPEVHAIAEAVARSLSPRERAQHVCVPEPRRDPVGGRRATADLFHGGPDAAGFMTSGGTESILMAVKAARERARAERGVTAPEMVIAGECPRRVPQGCALLRRARAQGAGSRRLACRRRPDGRLREREHRARCGFRAAVPAGRHRSDPRPRANSRRPSARRCTSTRAWAASSSRSWN